jgi:hypothetical protein
MHIVRRRWRFGLYKLDSSFELRLCPPDSGVNIPCCDTFASWSSRKSHFKFHVRMKFRYTAGPKVMTCKAVELWLLAWLDLGWRLHVEKQRCAGRCMSALQSNASHRARP